MGFRTHSAFASAAIFGAIALLATSCAHPGEESAERTQPDAARTIAVARTRVESLTRSIVLTAEFRPFQEVDVMAKVSGYVKTIRVDVGDRVHQGDLLATLEIPEMKDDLTRGGAAVERGISEVARAQDEVRRAESAHQMVHLSYLRLENVMKARPGLIAQQEIDDAQSKDLQAEAQIAAAKSNLAASEQQVNVEKAELARTTTMLAYAQVSAPFTGVITKRYADTGSMIQAGTASQTQVMPLVRLSQNSLLRLILPVPESAAAGIRVGQQVDVRVPTLQRSFPGAIARFDDKLDLDTRTMNTEVDVANPSLTLIPGMYAEVYLTVARSANALTVPLPALDRDTGDPEQAKTAKVICIGKDQLVQAKTVNTGIETAERVEILDGLGDGDLVVIGNRAGLRPGQKAIPKIVEMH